jgi:hypothetical protein
MGPVVSRFTFWQIDARKIKRLLHDQYNYRFVKGIPVEYPKVGKPFTQNTPNVVNLASGLIRRIEYWRSREHYITRLEWAGKIVLYNNLIENSKKVN